MIIPYITSARVSDPGVHTICEGIGALLAFRAAPAQDQGQTIYFKDGSEPLMTLMIPRGYSPKWVKLTKAPDFSQGIRFETSLVVKLEAACDLEIWYAVGENAFDG